MRTKGLGEVTPSLSGMWHVGTGDTRDTGLTLRVETHGPQEQRGLMAMLAVPPCVTLMQICSWLWVIDS